VALNYLRLCSRLVLHCAECPVRIPCEDATPDAYAEHRLRTTPLSPGSALRPWDPGYTVQNGEGEETAAGLAHDERGQYGVCLRASR